MFRIVKSAVFLLLSPLALADCLSSPALKALDYEYEQAIAQADLTRLDALLLPEYVWVHNHASLYETKAMLLERLGEGYKPPKSREQSDISVRRAGTTAVISGLSTVEQWTQGPVKANRYHYMRTWVYSDGQCRLLTAQTMKVWSTEKDWQ